MPTTSLELAVMAKYTLRRAIEERERGTRYSGGLSVSLTQDAVELMLGAIANKVGAQLTKEFLKQPEEIDKIAPANAKLPRRAMLQKLNSARVAFKHYGNLPDPVAAADLGREGEAFIRDTCQMYFGQPFESLSLASTISRADVREALVKADEFIAAGEWKKACELAALSYVLVAKDVVRGTGSRSGLDWRRGFERLAGGNTAREWEAREVAFALDRRLNLLEAITLVALVGIRPASLFRFRKCTPAVSVTDSGDSTFTWNPDHEPIGSPEASFAVQFAAELALRVEADFDPTMSTDRLRL